MSQLEYDMLKRLVKAQERTNELLEIQISLLKPKQEKQKRIPEEPKKEGHYERILT